MRNERRLVLFIVEGKSDKVSLEGVVRSILQNRHEPYFIMQSDLTSDNHVCPANIDRYLHQNINQELWKRRVKLSDVAEIVHIIDTDAAFIDEAQLEENPMNFGCTYFQQKVVVQNKNRIIERNTHKKYNVQALLDFPDIGGVPYRLYFFSINLEHVLHNNPNAATVRQKIYLSDKFDDQYSADVVGFLNFMSLPEILRFKTYEESWEYIRKPENALMRASNFYFALKSYLRFLNQG